MKKIKLFHKILFACVFCLILPLTVWAETDSYYGTATITTPANLGTIDLAFNLDVSGSAIQHDTSYIMLDKTLLFPAVPPQISGMDVGPRATGTLSATSFDLATDDFTSVVSNKTVTRKVTLTNSIVTNSGAAISGTYTETIIGLAPEVVTVTGSFILVKPTVPTDVPKDMNSDGWLNLAEIKAGGKDPNVMEFADVSYALHLFYNPAPGLQLGDALTDPTGELVIKAALAEFKNGQK